MHLAWLLRTATHWLLTFGEAALLVWGIALAVALAAWLGWCATWVLRRLGVTGLLAMSASRMKAGSTNRDRVAYRTRMER